jgi:serine/threonine protein phosphatase PrpC
MQRAMGDRAIMKVAAQSDLGRVRTTNEDCLLTDERLGLLMVADGMGGHAGGEVASAMAIATITSYVQGQLSGPERFAPTAALLQAAIRAADEAIWTQARTSRPLRGMGTTVVLALCQGTQIHLAHVGDSRAYLLQGGRLRQLTEDHSVVTQLIKAGQLTPRQARTHPLRHQITRSVGSGKAVAELRCVTWHPGDHLLLCSDGLTTMVADRQLKALILQAGGDVPAACEALVARANANGGEDNISVVLAQCA